MKTLSDFFNDAHRLLLAVASAGEASAVLRALGSTKSESTALDHGSSASSIAPPGDWNAIHFGNFSILQTGVGKANAAGAVARELVLAQNANRQYGAVLSLGIAGSLKADVAIGSTVCATAVRFGDEGTPCDQEQQWTCLETSGWAQTFFHCSHADWVQLLQTSADHSGTIATVSTISGSDRIAQDYHKRTSAMAEAMEGAAIAQVCLRFEIPFGEYRVISNRCGNRGFNKLDIPTSFKRLTESVQGWGFSRSESSQPIG